MLEDLITLVLGIALILFGLDPMIFSADSRKDPSMVIKSIILIVAGFFLMHYWNLNTKANYAVGA
jgi:hypothetical protein